MATLLRDCAPQRPWSQREDKTPKVNYKTFAQHQLDCGPVKFLGHFTTWITIVNIAKFVFGLDFRTDLLISLGLVAGHYMTYINPKEIDTSNIGCDPGLVVKGNLLRVLDIVNHKLPFIMIVLFAQNSRQFNQTDFFGSLLLIGVFWIFFDPRQVYGLSFKELSTLFVLGLVLTKAII